MVLYPLMRTPLLTALLLIASWCELSAQDDFVTVRGKLVDSETQEALPFASIYLQGTSIGTTSNNEGLFVFHVPAQLRQYHVIISMIGYDSQEKPVAEFSAQSTITLVPKIFQLSEVIVTRDKPLTAKQVVKKAYKSIAANYPSEPYILEGFIRDLQNEDSSFVELVECATKLYYQRNSMREEPDVELVELRQSFLAEKHPWNDQWERKNSIVDLVEDDFIRFDYGPIKGGDGWKYDIESILPFGDRLVYKIIATKAPFLSALLFIDINSMAFVRVEYSRQNRNGKYYKQRLASGQQEKAYNLVFEYQEYQGKWYLKYQKEEDTWEIFKGAESNQLLFTKYPKKELFINRIVVEDVEAFPFTANLDRFESIESQAKPYNAEFWEHYNFPAQTRTMSKIAAYLKQAQIQLGE